MSNKYQIRSILCIKSNNRVVSFCVLTSKRAITSREIKSMTLQFLLHSTFRGLCVLRLYHQAACPAPGPRGPRLHPDIPAPPAGRHLVLLTHQPLVSSPLTPPPGAVSSSCSRRSRTGPTWEDKARVLCPLQGAIEGACLGQGAAPRLSSPSKWKIFIRLPTPELSAWLETGSKLLPETNLFPSLRPPAPRLPGSDPVLARTPAGPGWPSWGTTFPDLHLPSDHWSRRSSAARTCGVLFIVEEEGGRGWWSLPPTPYLLPAFCPWKTLVKE